MKNALMSVSRLTKTFPIRGGIFARGARDVTAVNDVSFVIESGETLGLAGESGSGKSTTAKLLLLIDRPTSGDIVFDGKNAREFRKADWKAYRKSVQAVFQDPYGSLNPRMRVKTIIAEPMIVNGTMSRLDVRKRVVKLLDTVGLPNYAADLYPHEFSGGQRQRIAIARALSLHPRLLVLDEPVSALDVSIRAQIMNLLNDVQKEFGLTYLLIAHDLAVLRHMCHRIGIMYLGQIVELASSESIYSEPRHPYTRALLASVLPTHPQKNWRAPPLAGEMPSPLAPQIGCPFHPRCSQAVDRCKILRPVSREITPGHSVACHLY